MCGPSCGNLDSPPSRQNMSFIAIIELVIMICVGIVCLVEVITLLQSKISFTLIPILKVVVDGLIVAGLVLVLIGLFVLLNVDKNYHQSETVGYNICYIIVLVLVSWILWRQSYHI